jgi:hypothetical protein
MACESKTHSATSPPPRSPDRRAKSAVSALENTELHGRGGAPPSGSFLTG